MGIPVLILGESGSGKSASLRNFAPNQVAVFNVAGKMLPFRGKLKMINTDLYGTIKSGLSSGTALSYVIDDSQYLMANEFFDRAMEKGYDKYTELGLH